MTRIYIISKDKNHLKKLKKQLKSAGYKYKKRNPDLVISYGGDGTLLISERTYPQIPKIMLRDNGLGTGYNIENITKTIENIIKGREKLEEIPKLKANAHTNKGIKGLIGMNDIVIRNDLPTEALRFSLKIDNKYIGDFIGDGVVISTPYGSNAYYKSITQTSFRKGFAIALNNPTIPHNPLILNNNSHIMMKIKRGPAVLVADNNRDFIKLKEGDWVTIKQSSENARILKIQWL